MKKASEGISLLTPFSYQIAAGCFLRLTLLPAGSQHPQRMLDTPPVRSPLSPRHASKITPAIKKIKV
jgi:hypothetical protein